MADEVRPEPWSIVQDIYDALAAMREGGKSQVDIGHLMARLYLALAVARAYEGWARSTVVNPVTGIAEVSRCRYCRMTAAQATSVCRHDLVPRPDWVRPPRWGGEAR